jgi:exosortase/archaeosortase family protein
VYGYFFEKKIWLRVVLFVATVPIAMLANACRVTVTGILADYKPEYAHGLMHSASGMVIFMVALAFLGAFHQLMNFGYRALHGKR